MSIQNCDDIIRQCAGRPLTIGEIQGITGKVESRIIARLEAGQSRFAAAAAGRQPVGPEKMLVAFVRRFIHNRNNNPAVT